MEKPVIYAIIKHWKGEIEMLRYIICEDNKEFQNRLHTIINKVMMPYNFEYKINAFTKYNKDLKEIINRPNEQKVYVLDIELEDVSGLEIASEIRENDLESIIIFVTCHNECRNDIFYSRLLALDYIPKDKIWSMRFEETIKYVINALNKQQVLMFNYNRNSYRIPLDDILYVEKMQDNMKCTIHTEDGKEYTIISTIIGLTKRLGEGFFQSHKSCIVNLKKIAKVNYDDNIISFKNGTSAYLLSNRKKKQMRRYVEDN